MTVSVRQAMTLATAILLLLVVSCGDDGANVRDGQSASGQGSASAPAACEPFGDTDVYDTQIDVSEKEWSISAPDTVSAGAVKATVKNDGKEAHELVVVRAESVADIPTNDQGEVDEEAIPKEDFIGEIMPFPAGDTCEGVFDLEPGNYILFCAIVEDHNGEVVNHFAKGMSRVLTVE